jgi:SAM-dependent methyltransferase
MCGGKSRKRKSVIRAGTVAICNDCGGWYRTPRPVASDMDGIYTENYYDSWGLSENPESVELTKNATFAPILDQLETITAPYSKKGNLLDVGAATGTLLENAARRGWLPYAVELNPYSAGILRDKFGPQHVFEGALADYPATDTRFDVITMTDVLEHVFDIRKTLVTAASLLRDDGVLCITTPQIDSFSRILLGRQWLHFKEEHIQYFTARGITMALASAGFDRIQIRSHYKYLTLAYVHRQLQTFPHWLLTPTIAFTHSITPERFRIRPIRFRCGEMLVIGQASKDRY